MELQEEVKVGPKGQIVIPKVFRKLLGIFPGGRVILSLKNEKIMLEKPFLDAVAEFGRIAKMKPAVRTAKITPEPEAEIEERWDKVWEKKRKRK